MFTAGVGQDWICGEDGKPLYWPGGRLFLSGENGERNFLGCQVMKQHHTLTQIMSGVLDAGFTVSGSGRVRSRQRR